MIEFVDFTEAIGILQVRSLSYISLKIVGGVYIVIFYQKFFVIILVGIVMLFSFNDTVLAASNELSLDDCIFLALKNNKNEEDLG